MKPSDNQSRAAAKPYRVPALEKGLCILEYLCCNPGGKSFSDISAALGISRTTTFSILRNLTDSGYVRKGANGVFYAGLKIYSLGMEVILHLDKIELLPDLIALRDRLGYTVHALARGNRESIVLEKLDGTSTIAFKSYIGQRKPFHLSAGGKAILAYLPDDEFAIYSSGELERLTENSLCTVGQLEECRSQVRSKGYAVDNEEGESGVFCLGAPLFASGGGLWGAISVSTLKMLMDDDRLTVCSSQILEAGERVSRKMGYTGEYPVK